MRQSCLQHDARQGAKCCDQPPQAPHRALVLLQGHLQLVLVTIVYNNMRDKQELLTTHLFAALHRAIQASSYRAMVPALTKEQEKRSGLHATCHGKRWAVAVCAWASGQGAPEPWRSAVT